MFSGRGPVLALLFSAAVCHGIVPCAKPLADLTLSMHTVVALSEYLGEGGGQESRKVVRDRQDEALARRFAVGTALGNPAQRPLFVVAPVDLLVTENAQGEKKFHPLELNGTGIAGLTNMPNDVVRTVLKGFEELGEHHAKRGATVLVAFSGKEDPARPRISKTVYEKALYAEALKAGMERAGLKPRIVTYADLAKAPAGTYDPAEPLIVLGYIGEMLDGVSVGHDGALRVGDRTVSLGVNDRFCLNVAKKFGDKLDLRKFATANHVFQAGADKAVAYELFNEYIKKHPSPYFPDEVNFAKARTRRELIDLVMGRLKSGKEVVIKPQGTGLGHGIKIFRRSASKSEITHEIDDSLRTTATFYKVPGGALPYTVCDFIDSAVIKQPGHPKLGHKYELRVVVYRDGGELKAFPSIVKISGTRYDAANPTEQSQYINNIGAGAVRNKVAGTELMLPLSNEETMKQLGLTPEHMKALDATLTGYVRFILDEAQRNPARFGL